AKNFLCGWIPTGHDSIQVFAHDGIVRGLDDGGQALGNQESSLDLFRSFLLLVNIKASAEIALKGSIRGISGDAMVENPAKFAAVMPQPVVHFKRLTRIERADI